MARKQRDDDLLMEDELTAAFLGEDEFEETAVIQEQDTDQDPQQNQTPLPAQDEWDEEEAVPGQLAVDVLRLKKNLWLRLGRPV